MKFASSEAFRSWANVYRDAFFFFLKLWRYSSISELFRLPEWWEDTIASGQGPFGERSPLGSQFPESLFLGVPGTATEQVRTCGFRRNSSSLEKAPKIRDSVRLKTFESSLVTLPSISSEIWEMYSWANSGSSVFRDWLFLVFSGVSLETAASFLLFSKLPWYWKKSSASSGGWIDVFIFIIQSDDHLLLWGERVSTILIKSTIPEGYNLYNNISTFISPIYTFPWRET